jgi:hypothetical protein
MNSADVVQQSGGEHGLGLPDLRGMPRQLPRDDRGLDTVLPEDLHRKRRVIVAAENPAQHRTDQDMLEPFPAQQRHRLGNRGYLVRQPIVGAIDHLQHARGDRRIVLHGIADLLHAAVFVFELLRDAQVDFGQAGQVLAFANKLFQRHGRDNVEFGISHNAIELSRENRENSVRYLTLRERCSWPRYGRLMLLSGRYWRSRVESFLSLTQGRTVASKSRK